MNKVMLIGNVGSDLQLINSNTPQARCTFAITISETRKTQDGNYERVSVWHNIVAFNKTAEISARSLCKGKHVLIEGKLQQKRWEDKTGAKHTSYEIIASAIYPLAEEPAADRAGAACEVPTEMAA